jgi:hypothetical protein
MPNKVVVGMSANQSCKCVSFQGKFILGRQESDSKSIFNCKTSCTLILFNALHRDSYIYIVTQDLYFWLFFASVISNNMPLSNNNKNHSFISMQLAVAAAPSLHSVVVVQR